ncbi:methyltransferase domain-containing protein [Methylomicrobium sp. Wu6]|nr:methyltransferase domain-containing protein [Methylomicrobium sp. Wu6]
MSAYNWNAGDYQQNSAAQQQWASELIAKLALTGSEDVLDLGCGDGKVTAEIADLVPNGTVIGIDNSSSMVTLARRQYPASRYPNLIFELMDARALAFENRFDVVFSNAVLHWIKDHRSVVEGLFKSLKPGGKILLQMGAKDGVRSYLSVLNQILLLPEWKAYFQNFEFPYGFMGIEDYEGMLLAAGFQTQRVELISKDAVHANREKFKGWIRTTWLPYTERVSEGEREQFIELIATSYLEKAPLDAEGRVHVPMVRLEVEAEKV